MKDRPIVSSQTVDLDHLKSLQRGTLGREYVEWLQRGDLSPDSRETVSLSYRILHIEADGSGPIYRFTDSCLYYAPLPTNTRSIPYSILSTTYTSS